jgi:anaerobic ribonucleoside-triphosphate reductase activating protein
MLEIILYNMKIYNYNIVLQEIPDEISLAIAVHGCQLKCNSCSYKQLIGKEFEFTINDLEKLIIKNKPYITCVLFLGGEWETNIIKYIKTTHKYKLKTALYTGLELHEINNILLKNFNYIKTGKYNGVPVSNPLTNQKFFKIINGLAVNHTDLLWRNK